jgi:hypothetical protein
MSILLTLLMSLNKLSIASRAFAEKVDPLMEKLISAAGFNNISKVFERDYGQQMGTRVNFNMAKLPVKRIGLKKLTEVYSPAIRKGFSAENWLKMFRIYSNSGMRLRNAENDWITGFGENFDSFKGEQLIHFTQSLT